MTLQPLLGGKSLDHDRPRYQQHALTMFANVVKMSRTQTNSNVHNMEAL